MKRSVVIIAHNEELMIETCIKSILVQTLLPDEIILVAHNCTDQTVTKASQFPTVTIKELHGNPGIVHARMHGISSAIGDRVFCIDGDAYATKNWVASLDALLDKSPNSLVGSYVRCTHNLFWTFCNYLNWILSLIGRNKSFWIFGPSFAFSKSTKSLILESLQEFPEVFSKLNLSGYPDDFWVALKCQQVAPALYTHKSTVSAKARTSSFWKEFIRSIKSNKNAVVMRNYLSTTDRR